MSFETHVRLTAGNSHPPAHLKCMQAWKIDTPNILPQRNKSRVFRVRYRSVVDLWSISS